MFTRFFTPAGAPRPPSGVVGVGVLDPATAATTAATAATTTASSAARVGDNNLSVATGPAPLSTAETPPQHPHPLLHHERNVDDHPLTAPLDPLRDPASVEDDDDTNPVTTAATAAAAAAAAAAAGAAVPSADIETAFWRSRHGGFSETDFMDSGMGRSHYSELPFLGLPEEHDESQFDHVFSEEYLLSKLHDAHRRLREIREYKENIACSSPAELLPSTAVEVPISVSAVGENSQAGNLSHMPPPPPNSGNSLHHQEKQSLPTHPEAVTRYDEHPTVVPIRPAKPSASALSVVATLPRPHAASALAPESMSSSADTNSTVSGPPRTSPAPSSARVRRNDRLFVASYRLPLKIAIDADGIVQSSVTTGGLGLVSAFRELLGRTPIQWIGAPGEFLYDAESLSPEVRAVVEKRLYNQPHSNRSTVHGLLRYLPIFPEPEDARAHQDFCDSVLWQLVHYLPLGFEGERMYNDETFAAYQRVNVVYAEALIDQWEASDIDEFDAMFWIHDLHLFLVPKMLRERIPHARIGFFLHTPFPADEVYRTLPARKELLEGMLGADLIGFHTYDYARHFLSACERLLGLNIRPDAVDYNGVQVQIGIYPFGIDTESFRNAMNTRSVLKMRDDLKESLAGKRIIIGVDRLDFIKGIPNKLLAIEHLLETRPEWREKLVLLQVATPSRTQSEEYQSFRSNVLEMVGRINGRFGTLEDMPIHYRELGLTFEELCALYAIADVAVLTSIRDGMNLVSYEYVMCQSEHHGALVLSEFAGAAQNLPGALRCNPWNIEQVSNAIQEALEMSEAERRTNHGKMYRYVMFNTSAAWGVHFIDDLVKYAARRRDAVAKLVLLPPNDVLLAYRSAKRRLLLLDYDGTLRKYEALPELAEPTDRLLAILRRLVSDPENVVFIVTGRQRGIMMNWFGDVGIGFAVEHGFLLRWPDHIRGKFGGAKHRILAEDKNEKNGWGEFGSEWDAMLGPAAVQAMRATLQNADVLLGRMEKYMPTSFLSAKESALTWHFRDADPDFAYAAAQDARQALDEVLKDSPMEVLMSSESIHVRPRGVSKGAAAAEVLQRMAQGGWAPDFVLCVGDDRTDEDMYEVVHHQATEVGFRVTTCTVGRKTTKAQFYTQSVDDVLDLLESCAGQKGQP